jgi:phosphatidylglycerophosphate synthase
VGLGHEGSIVTEAARDSTPHPFSSQAANLLSASRFILAIAWLGAFETDHRSAAMLGSIALAGAISDLLDGRIARRMHIAGGVGRWLDAIADITFVLTALICEAFARAIPLYIPILIAISFSQYTIDSILLAGAPIKSRLGHFGGIINYALVIVLGVAPATAGLVRAICPPLAIFYLCAIAERIVGYFRR